MKSKKLYRFSSKPKSYLSQYKKKVKFSSLLQKRNEEPFEENQNFLANNIENTVDANKVYPDHTKSNPVYPMPKQKAPQKELSIIKNKTKINPYLKTKVQTASGGELIIMLYEKAISLLYAAIDILDNNFELSQTQNVSEKIQRAQEIILELLYSLNLESGGEFEKKMSSIYSFMNKELSEANIEKKSKRIKPIINQLEILLEAWRKANEQLKKQDQPIQKSSGDVQIV